MFSAEGGQSLSEINTGSWRGSDRRTWGVKSPGRSCKYTWIQPDIPSSTSTSSGVSGHGAPSSGTPMIFWGYSLFWHPVFLSFFFFYHPLPSSLCSEIILRIILAAGPYTAAQGGCRASGGIIFSCSFKPRRWREQLPGDTR